VQESLNLELCLQRYEELKFQGLLHEIFWARDLSQNIFSKTRGLTVKILDCGLITQESMDLFTRSLNNRD
jgi:hypothetical protein